MKKVLAVAMFLLPAMVFAHEHKAPHGGTLIELGEEFAHLELVLDSKEGKLTTYVLDGEAEKAVRIKQTEIEFKIAKVKTKGTLYYNTQITREAELENLLRDPVILKLKAVANVLTGEKEGDSSQFECKNDILWNATGFSAVVTAITVKGKEFTKVKVNFPEGNEAEKHGGGDK